MRPRPNQASAASVQSCEDALIPSHRMRILASLAVVFAAGCPSMIRQSAVDAIGAQIQPPNVALVNQLKSAGNPTGEGVIVFAGSESSCIPRYSWIWLNHKTPSYALDAASQALTPGLRTLSEAPQSILKRVGSEPGSFAEAVRRWLCQTPR